MLFRSHVRGNGSGLTALLSLTSVTLGATGLTAPLMGAGRLYVGDGQGRLHRLNAVTGAEAAGWPKRLITVDLYGKTVMLGDPVFHLSSKRLFIATSEGKIYAIYDP